MIKYIERLHLAVLVLKVSHLLMENAELLHELISKVVNYAVSIREFSVLLLEQWKANICAERLQRRTWKLA